MLRVHLKELTLNNYRNYQSLSLKFDGGRILFVGRNAQGKTNILESIFLTCTGRSHRTPRDSELIRWGQDSCYIKVLVERRVGYNSIEVFLSLKDKKRIKINGVTIQKLGQLMGHFNAVIFSPEDLRLVKEAPSERRRYMDMEISQIRPQYFYNLQQYNRILAHRNNLLKEIDKNPEAKKMLAVFDEQLSEVGAFIIKQRYEFIESLSKIAREIHARISSGAERLDIKYRPSIRASSLDAGDIRKEFFAALEKNKWEDIQRGSTGVGCHRDDIGFEINGVDVRVFGSQGQQRTVALSLKLSDIELMYRETGEYPVLLLDDVMSELDEWRHRRLFEELGDVQVFVTATDLNSIPPCELEKFDIYEVEEGKVTKRQIYE
ncbi:MAG: DNA replication/repair protein RecF [Caldicoprobacter oshimai]